MSDVQNQNAENLEKATPEKEENLIKEGIKTVVLAVILAFGIRTFIAEARYIPSSSMEPTLQIDDRLIIDKVTYKFTNPSRQDIVVFYPTEKLEQQNFHEAFIKRVVGIPGDVVEVRNGVLFLNGTPQTEDYIKEAPNYNYGPVTVPADSYLVLGDNRNQSYDSHFWGFVPRNKIIGRAIIRFWPVNRMGGVEK